MPSVSRAVRRSIAQHKSLRIDLGCGSHKQAGCFGVDARALEGVDLVHDLQSFPWPLPDSCARVVFMSHFWEHIHPQKVMDFMKELHRICEPGAQVLIASPYGVEFRFVQDPTHCNPSNEATFLYWDKTDASGLWNVYQPPCFHVNAFDIIPVGASRDFNAFLTCCKPSEKPCELCAEGTAPAVSAPAAPARAAKRGRTTRRARIAGSAGSGG